MFFSMCLSSFMIKPLWSLMRFKVQNSYALPLTTPWKWNWQVRKMQMQKYWWTRQLKVDRYMEGRTTKSKMCLQDAVVFGFGFLFVFALFPLILGVFLCFVGFEFWFCVGFFVCCWLFFLIIVMLFITSWINKENTWFGSIYLLPLVTD